MWSKENLLLYACYVTALVAVLVLYNPIVRRGLFGQFVYLTLAPFALGAILGGEVKWGVAAILLVHVAAYFRW